MRKTAIRVLGLFIIVILMVWSLIYLFRSDYPQTFWLLLIVYLFSILKIDFKKFFNL